MDPHPSPGSPSSDRILSGDATVAVVGLGYVGLPVAHAFHAAGHRVIGFDNDAGKVERLRRGDAYLRHIPPEVWEAFSTSDRFVATGDPERFRDADAVLLCVPTPLEEDRTPDLSFVRESARTLAPRLRDGALVVLESTSFPGTTREVLRPVIEESLGPGVRVHYAYSPEREDPGRTDVHTVEVPKLVGGLDSAAGDLAEALYGRAFQRVVRVSSAEVAEAAKILENVYRAVNIALVNEMKLILGKMDLDIWEVVEAAATKPYGFQPFRPGPGLGGHCIPVDPFYLTWRAAEVGAPTRFIELAGEINTAMPSHVVARVRDALAETGRGLAGSRILVLGIAYKPGVDDVRETPAAPIITELCEGGAEVEYHDPLVPEFPPMRRWALSLSSVDLTPDRLAGADCVLVVTDQPSIDWDSVAEHAPLIVDTRNALAGREVRGRLRKA